MDQPALHALEPLAHLAPGKLGVRTLFLQQLFDLFHVGALALYGMLQPAEQPGRGQVMGFGRHLFVLSVSGHGSPPEIMIAHYASTSAATASTTACTAAAVVAAAMSMIAVCRATSICVRKYR
ncbi:MAG: hypothetical protein BWX69_03039 [Planctomycetes bacterium ADurb.Bin069]|nr:MAG: hypothetical protein BWX69_03039 [Planctomycetes bacterium ADurb.Bin069]